MTSIAAEDAILEDVAVTENRSLTALDRCDHCGAQAYHRVVLATGELLFCGHHGRALREGLEGVALHWQDESERLHA